LKKSIIVTSRVQGNKNHRLPILLDTLKENTREINDIEVLIKYDDDDEHAHDLYHRIYGSAWEKYPFKMKQIFGKRGRGYIDIHKGYNSLLKFVSNETKIIVAMADDFTVEKDWDIKMDDCVKDAGDYFIIHQRPHPPITRPNFSHEKFDVSYNPFYSEDLHIIDEAPAWSKALIDAVKDFPLSFTDAWTLCVERVLWFKHDIRLTRFTDGLIINRYTSEVDQPENDRWNTDRKTNFDYMKTQEFRNIIEEQSQRIAEAMKK